MSDTHRHIVTTVEALVAAVRDASEGAVIEIGPGTFALDAPLEPKARMTLTGTGVGKTILTHTPEWEPSTASLPDPETKTQGMDTRAYLIRLRDNAAGITVSGMTLRGPQLHGAIFGFRNENLHLHHLRIEDVRWSGIRTLSMQGAKIHDCEFVDAGGPVPASGRTFHIHHNYLTSSYAIEFVRNGVEIDHNLFDFDPAKDGGNLISGFGSIQITDNVIECWGEARPLMRNPESFGATIRNNSLAGVSDIAYYCNSQTGARQGPEEPLEFQAGVHGELTVENWETRPTNPGGN